MTVRQFRFFAVMPDDAPARQTRADDFVDERRL
jgi:hypothetical protein